LLDQASKGRISLTQIAEWTSEGPARTYEIPRKGRLEVGYDADLVLVDTAATRTVEDAGVFTKCGWSPYSGMSLTGWPVMTVVLGRPVFREGEIQTGIYGRELTFSQ